MDKGMALAAMYLRVETHLEEWPCGCRKNTAAHHNYKICVGYTEKILKAKISSLEFKLAIAKEALEAIAQNHRDDIECFREHGMCTTRSHSSIDEALSKLNEEEA